MANAFSPTVQPPVTESPDLAASFLAGHREGVNAWQAHANANAKQQQMENQLAHYALQAQQLQGQDALREKQFELRAREQDLSTGYKLTMADIAQQRLTKTFEDKERDDKWRERKYTEQSDAKGELMDAESILASRNKYPGDPGYMEDWIELTPNAKKFLPNPVYTKVYSRVGDAHNKNAVMAWNQFTQEDKRLKDKVLADAYAGKLEGGATDPIVNYSQLQPETKGTGFLWHNQTPTGKLLVPQPDGTTLPVAVNVLQDLKKQIEEHEERRKHLPQTYHAPESGIHDVGQEPAPLDPSKRENNKVYHVKTDKVDGQYRWVNGQWANP